MNIFLMHKDNPVVLLNMDFDGNIISVGDRYNQELLPLSVQRDVHLIKSWLTERAVPKTRSGIASVLDINGERNTQSILIRNLGLSLTDSYWLKPINSHYTWDKINLFTNPFHPSEAYKDMGKNSLGIYLRLSPNSSLQGELKKKWFIDENGDRILVKGNYGENCQQSLNEEFATLINKKQNRIPFTEYTVKPYAFQDNETQAFCCFSHNFIHSDKEEFIPAWEIAHYIRYEKHVGEFQHFVKACESLGMDRDYVTEFLSYQILLDYIITNTDRHFNNFGVIRDTETLRFVKMAPIYDCGNSMFWNQNYIEYNPRMLDKIETCSFRKKERELLQYVSDANLLDISQLPNENELYQIYSKDKFLSEKKIETMQKCMMYKANQIEHMQIKQSMHALADANRQNKQDAEKDDYEVEER